MDMPSESRPWPVALTRRAFLRTGLLAATAPALLGCRGVPTAPDRRTNRLAARPGPIQTDAEPGESRLGLGDDRDGLLYVPRSYDPARSWPLFVALHGATGNAAGWRSFFPAADEVGMVVLVPESRGRTWDRVRGEFGPDVAFLDQALAHVFRRVPVDPGRICLGGFSDGASYALSLGVSNGDLFTHLVGFSPGFMDAAEPLVGSPGIWISHGTEDTILPVRQSRDLIVPALREAGYDVTYREFEGGHQVPPAIARDALGWWTGRADP